MNHVVRIKEARNITHDVRLLRTERPDGYAFTPGQATEVAINKPGWQDEKRPFTFTSLNDDSDLEFIIKVYKDHQSVTAQIENLLPGDELIIGDVWGAIEYKGPGYFIAGGAGITPFIAIFRSLQKSGTLKNNTLIFSNKTDGDIILEKELGGMLHKEALFLVTDADSDKYSRSFINREYLQSTIKDFGAHFYLCGPPKMVSDIQALLTDLGARPDAVVFEN